MTGRIRYSSRRLAGRRDGRRLVTMICMLFLLGMMISHTSKPETWHWLAEDVAIAQEFGGVQASAEGEKATEPTKPAAETLIPNPTDQDPEEWAKAQDQFRNILDKQPINVEDMPSYWRLFRWSRAQTQDELLKRSVKNPFFTQIWETPAKNRGKPYTLKLYVRRVLSHEPEENSAGVKKVYEIWGVTEESRANLFVIVTDQLPPGFPEGDKVEATALFTGYFLKILGYQAFDAQRGAPLMIGKIKANPVRQGGGKNPPIAQDMMWLTVLAGILICGFLWVSQYIPWPWRTVQARPGRDIIRVTEEDVETWLAKPPSNPPVQPPPIVDKNDK
ncbi:hypothetical protein [Planctomicrobium sp. SH527]|uniref:hypothetical protein n=1 Tax=Planctomicrobium sp. SH527 TaxID=3448123 RepID=UPI003F5C8EB4